jgi:hypothetical protein
MSVTFAAARLPARSPVTQALVRRDLPTVANDNPSLEQGEEDLLQASLRHFAIHGLGAARSAYRAAEAALKDHDAAAYHRWTAICRTLDSRLAARLSPWCAGNS